MGLFDNIFGGEDRRRREMAELMNPLLGYRLQHFVAFTADPAYLRHWFSFKNKEDQIEEFITNYAVFDGRATYLRTHWKKPGEDFFVTLSERGPWSSSITFLIELGKRQPVSTLSPESHPARNISPDAQTSSRLEAACDRNASAYSGFAIAMAGDPRTGAAKIPSAKPSWVRSWGSLCLPTASKPWDVLWTWRNLKESMVRLTASSSSSITMKQKCEYRSGSYVI